MEAALSQTIQRLRRKESKAPAGSCRNAEWNAEFLSGETAHWEHGHGNLVT